MSIYIFMIRAISYFVIFTLVWYTYYIESYERNKLQSFFIIFKFAILYKNYFYKITSLFTSSLGMSIYFFMIRAILSFVIFTLVWYAYLKNPMKGISLNNFLSYSNLLFYIKIIFLNFINIYVIAQHEHIFFHDQNNFILCNFYISLICLL